VIAMFGIGLASAVALDAFVLRTLLVPALMHVLGDANWWLPGWLDRRLPRISIEAPTAARPAPAGPLVPVVVPVVPQPAATGEDQGISVGSASTPMPQVDWDSSASHSMRSRSTPETSKTG
jgi:RND superfamily putative drug exporter